MRAAAATWPTLLNWKALLRGQGKVFQRHWEQIEKGKRYFGRALLDVSRVSPGPCVAT